MFPLPGYGCEGCHLAVSKETGAHSLLMKYPTAKYMRKTLFGVEAMLRPMCDVFGGNVWVPDGLCMAYCPGGMGEPLSQNYFYRVDPKKISIGSGLLYEPHHEMYNPILAEMGEGVLIETREPTIVVCQPPLACRGANECHRNVGCETRQITNESVTSPSYCSQSRFTRLFDIPFQSAVTTYDMYYEHVFLLWY